MTDRFVHHASGEGTRVLTSVGTPIVVKAGDGETDGAYAIFEWTLDAGAGPQEHTHAYEDEAFYVISGKLNVRVGERAFTALEGSFVLMPRGEPHSFKVESAASLLTIMSPAGFERFLEERSDHLRAAGSVPPEVVADLVAAHHRRMEQRSGAGGA